MVDYEILEATLRRIEPNVPNGKFSVIAESADGRYFQIKFCEVGGRHNINEFIAHYVGKEIGAPMIDGAFLELSDQELAKVIGFLKAHSGIFRDLDLSISKDHLFFGVQWEKDTVDIKEESELMTKVSKTTNKNTFYSLYPFDQFMKNYDRHLGNHLIVKYANTMYYRLIDFDRLFGQTDWRAIPLLINDFGCLNLKDYHRFLYSIVKNDGHDHVLRYSYNISMLHSDAVADIIQTISHVYTVSQNELDMIHAWLSGRSRLMYDKCLENNDCFVNVKQKRLNVCSSTPDQKVSTYIDTRLSNTIMP